MNLFIGVVGVLYLCGDRQEKWDDILPNVMGESTTITSIDVQD